MSNPYTATEAAILAAAEYYGIEAEAIKIADVFPCADKRADWSVYLELPRGCSGGSHALYWVLGNVATLLQSDATQALPNPEELGGPVPCPVCNAQECTPEHAARRTATTEELLSKFAGE